MNELSFITQRSTISRTYSLDPNNVSNQLHFSALLSQSAANTGNAPATISTSFDDIFARASHKYNVPENLLKAIAKAESNFNPSAVSGSGAQGVMQLMPGTAAGLGVTDAFDPEQNIMGGAKYISQMLDRFGGDTTLALAAYNAGPGAVSKYGGVPPYKETQNYVKTVQGYMGQSLSVPSTPLTVKTGAAGASSSGSGDAITDYIEEMKAQQNIAFLTRYMTQLEESNKEGSQHTIPL